MVVIGNGESRIDIDLDRLSSPKIGCNAVVREHFIDSVVCVDRKMLKECAQYCLNFDTCYTRSNLRLSTDISQIQSVPDLPYEGSQRWDDPFHWGSGPYAVLIAAGLCDTVEMIGFDLYSNDKCVNNCYKDTENYDSSSKRAVDPRYWIHQISKVFECFPQTQFTIYQTLDWQLPQKWNLPNVQVDKISNFTYN
jgi:hypothetical protein